MSLVSRAIRLFAFALLGAAATIAAADAAPSTAEPKLRVVIMTDIGGDPDDEQSLVRLLLYACDFDLEGLVTGLGHGHSSNTRPDLIRQYVGAYGQVLPSLRRHRADYPSEEYLLGLVKKGRDIEPSAIGEGKDSEGSDWIIRVLEKPDPRPVWFPMWGGPRELAQALWRIEKTRSATELAAIKRKIRIHSIADQDGTAGWIKKSHPDVFYVFSQRLFRGIYEGDQSLVSLEWVNSHVREGHGPLGALYPEGAHGKIGVKEGDTPSFLYLVPCGLSDPEHPEWGGWGGRFRSTGHGANYIDAADRHAGKDDSLWTVARWRQACQNAFQARMEWCVKPFAEANHEPVAACNGDRSRRVLMIDAEAGTTVRLSAAGSADPDGNRLHYRWWVYREAGTYPGEMTITGGDREDATLALPADAAGKSVHVVLEVTDDGNPPLTAYRRIVLNVKKPSR